MHRMLTLSHGNTLGAPLPLNKWCEEEAQPYILEVVRKNKQEHDTFLEIIAKAKQ